MNMSTSTILSGLGVGGTTTLGIVIAEAAITGGSMVSLKEAVAVGAFSCGVIWWLGRRFQRIEDTLTEHSRVLNSLPCSRTGVMCSEKEKEKP